jgi:TRAP-type C4-dicarboxylate transport system substrate-binding protein
MFVASVVANQKKTVTEPGYTEQTEKNGEEKMYSRIVVCAFVIASLCTFWLSGPASAQQSTVTLKVAHIAPALSTSALWFKAVKKELADKTAGRLNLDVFWSSSMGPFPRHYDFARKGVADLSFFQHGATPGRFPLNELTHLPYLFPNGPKGALVAAKVAADMLNAGLAAEHKGTKALWLTFTRPTNVFDAGKPIRTVADIKGRRYRVGTRTGGDLLRKLGAIPIGMPATLMAESLQKSTIDGVVTGPTGIVAFRMGKLVKYQTPMINSVISFGLVMNLKSYAKLPAEFRGLIDELASRENAVRMARLTWVDIPSSERYLKDSGLKIVDLMPEADRTMRKAAANVIDDVLANLEKKGIPARAVYAKMKALSAKYAQEQ